MKKIDLKKVILQKQIAIKGKDAIKIKKLKGV